MRGTNGANGNGHQNGNGSIHQVSRAEGLALLEAQTQKWLGMSARDFIAAWQDGKFRDEHEHPEAVRLAMMIPLAGSGRA